MALAHGIVHKGDPGYKIWSLLLKHYHRNNPEWKLEINLHEDNAAAVTGDATGKNPSCKTLERNFGVKVGMIHERFKSRDYAIVKTKTDYMAADIYTKVMGSPILFRSLRKIINVFTSQELETMDVNPHLCFNIDTDEFDKDLNPDWLNRQFHNVMIGKPLRYGENKKAINPKSSRVRAKEKAKARSTKKATFCGTYRCCDHGGDWSEDEFPVITGSTGNRGVTADNLPLQNTSNGCTVRATATGCTGGEYYKPGDEIQRVCTILNATSNYGTDSKEHRPYRTLGGRNPNDLRDTVTEYFNQFGDADKEPWTVLLLCTDPGTWMELLNAAGNRCKFICVTKDDDFTTETGLTRVVEIITNTPRILVFASLPCTGGCSWNVGMNASNPNCDERLKEHEMQFQALWHNFVRLLTLCPVFPLVFEWPRTCEYWRRQYVLDTFQKIGAVSADFDGCRYGTCNAKGEPLQKQWRFATTVPEVAYMFDLKCLRNHTHGDMFGKDARNTQYYTPSMALILHLAWFHYFHSPLTESSGYDRWLDYHYRLVPGKMANTMEFTESVIADIYRNQNGFAGTPKRKNTILSMLENLTYRS